MQSHRSSLVIGIALMGTLGAIYAIASTILLNSFAQVEQRRVEEDIVHATDTVNKDSKDGLLAGYSELEVFGGFLAAARRSGWRHDLAVVEPNCGIFSRARSPGTVPYSRSHPRQSEAKYRTKAEELEHTLQVLQQAQAHLIQSEKMSSLGQLVAGIAHEINNPVSFIHGNVTHLKRHVQDLMKLVHLYQKHYPTPALEIQTQVVQLDANFLLTDLPLILSSVQAGSERIREIVLSLRNFSRLDESDMKFVDIHEGIDSALLILQNRLNSNRHRAEICILKEYGDLPQVECYPGQLNQVLMSLLVNAIDAIDEAWEEQGRVLQDTRKGSLQDSTTDSPTIQIKTQPSQQQVAIRIIDNGKGISETVQKKLFDPFFTTKSVGAGTGMGLAISYQIIVEKHQGQLWCCSHLGQGAEFVVQIPIQQSKC